MKNQFCNYEISRNLKELGFDEKCFGYYNENGVLIQFHNVNVFWNCNTNIAYNRNIENLFRKSHSEKLMCTAPLHQQAVNWIYDTYKIIIGIETCGHTDWCAYIRMSTMALEDIIEIKGVYNEENRHLALEQAILITTQELLKNELPTI